MPSNKAIFEKHDISRRAERYASEKVEEMIGTLTTSSTSRSSRHGHSRHGHILDYRGRPMEQEETGAFPTLPRPVSSSSSPSSSSHNQNKLYSTASRAAAEELAAARVEAMMANLSTHKLEDNEGEI
jgi:hypothetical protein